MRKRSMGVCFVGLLVSAIIIGGIYVLMTQTPLEDYDSTVTIADDYYASAENISIYYDVCFHNVTFNVVDDPGFMIEINYKLKVLVEGAKGKNTNLQVQHSGNGRYVSIQILKENPADVCALNRGDAEAFVNVTINRAYTIDIEALAGHGNINMTATNSTFSDIYFHHGINCPGSNGIYLTNSTVYGDLTCQVTTGSFFVRLDTVDVRGTISCTPTGSGTLIEL
ncbi:MAG: hypothetical protein ACTSSE_06305 [Candidatus Thorarchaeota archaeon]